MTRNDLVTGSSTGIGRETARLFAKKGFNVIINCSSNVESLSDLQAEIMALGVDCLAFVGDVGQYDEIDRLFNEMAKKNLIPDIIINNAGISHVGLLQDMSIGEWNRVISTNLTAAFNTSKLAIPYFLQKGHGKIINISSMWGSAGASCEVAYSASKGGLNTFTRALAKELAPMNIQVNAVAFGVTDTRMNDFLTAEEKRALLEEIPAGRMCSAKEAAEIIYSVASLNEYVTGQIINADGGYI